jgi:hypothetical protein
MQEKCAEEKLDETGAKVDIRKKIFGPTCTTGVSTSSTPKNATKLQHLHTHRTSMIHNTYNSDNKVEMNFENWYPYLEEGGRGCILEKLTPYSCFIMELGSIPVH